MRTPEEIEAARQAEADELHAIRDFCRARLENLTDAVRGWTTEHGTTSDQDELLFVAGFRNDLRNARTSCGFGIDIERQPDGQLVGRMPAEVWLRRFGQHATAMVLGVGHVAIVMPTDEDLIDIQLRDELGSNALHFLPPWGRDAVRAAFVERICPTPAPERPVAKKVPAKKVARRFP